MLAHLWYDALLALGVILAALLGKHGFDNTIEWWQIPIILVGYVFWDLGWHARQHHPDEDVWTKHPLVLAIAFMVATTGAVL